MKTLYTNTPQVVAQAIDNSRSIPAEMTLSGPIEQVVSTHKVHPQEMSTVADLPLVPAQSFHVSIPEL